jgi:uncharacterized repeat protein (TIGR03837 family)
VGQALTVDLVCQVVDNYGDIAVVWRLAQALVQDGPADLRVRLLVDDLEAFHALNPAVDPRRARQSLACGGGKVIVLDTRADLGEALAADVLVEAFGAPTPEPWLQAFFAAAAEGTTTKTILHLEYLTAEAWSESYHGLPSPLGRPRVQRFFFVPGFRQGAGGLVFTDPPAQPSARGSEDWLMSLFSYEHDFTCFWEDLADFLDERRQTARVVVCAGRSRAGALESWQRVSARRGGLPRVTVDDPGFLDQREYTSLLAAGDFHVVRGEESWVQAVLSGKAFLWQAYLQPEGHQSVKVDAFLDVWRPRFEAQGEAGLAVFERVSREYRAMNVRLANSSSDVPREGYRVFWENRDLIETVNRAWAQELRKNAKLSRKMLEFLEKVRV